MITESLPGKQLQLPCLADKLLSSDYEPGEQQTTCVAPYLLYEDIFCRFELTTILPGHLMYFRGHQRDSRGELLSKDVVARKLFLFLSLVM